jgi:cytochrome c oxidase assembly protein Cox11
VRIIDFEARKGCSGQSAVGDAGLNDLPKRAAAYFQAACRCGKRERDGDA